MKLQRADFQNGFGPSDRGHLPFIHEMKRLARFALQISQNRSREVSPLLHRDGSSTWQWLSRLMRESSLISGDEYIRSTRYTEVRFNNRPALGVAFQAGRPRESRSFHTRGPNYRACTDALAAHLNSVRVDCGDTPRGSHFNAQPLKIPHRLRGLRFRKGRKDPWAGFDEEHPCRFGINGPEVSGQREPAHLADGPRQFDACRPAANDHEGQLLPPLIRIGRTLCVLKCSQHTATDFGRLFESLESGSKLLPVVVAEIRVRGAASENEIVEGKRSDIRRNEFSMEVDGGDLPQQHANIRILRKHGSNRSGYLCRTESGHRYLVQKRLEQVMIALIDQRHIHFRFSTKTLRSVYAGEPAPHNDNPFHATPLRDIMPRMIRNAYPSDLPGIVAIYNASIPGRLATADTEPISMESRRSWLLDRDFAKHPVWVCEDPMRPGRISGWLSFKPFYGRPAYAETAEVSIYVDPAAQRTGIATRLMKHAIQQAALLQLKTFLAFVFAHNAPSLELCRKFGFEQWGHLPRIAVLDGMDRDLLILGKRI